MIAPHPLERLIRDLRTYLRQPNPDAALAACRSGGRQRYSGTRAAHDDTSCITRRFSP